MQKTARAGQKRWKEQVEKMRAAANKSKPSKDLSEQMAECKRRKLKSQKEALLLFLHSLKRDGLITAGPFCNALDTDKGFVGWTSFSVCKQSAADFYTRVESLFGEGKPQPNTVNSIFRRAGLLPKRAGDWTNAYAGKVLLGACSCAHCRGRAASGAALCLQGCVAAAAFSDGLVRVADSFRFRGRSRDSRLSVVLMSEQGKALGKGQEPAKHKVGSVPPGARFYLGKRHGFRYVSACVGARERKNPCGLASRVGWPRLAGFG